MALSMAFLTLSRAPSTASITSMAAATVTPQTSNCCVYSVSALSTHSLHLVTTAQYHVLYVLLYILFSEKSEKYKL